MRGWDEAPARGEAFERAFREFARERSIILKTGERPSQDHQRWRIKAYQAVFVPPRIRNPDKSGTRRIDNPHFGALSLYFELCDRNDIKAVLSNRSALPYNRANTRRYLRALLATRNASGRPKRAKSHILATYPGEPDALSAREREGLERAIAQDFELELTDLLPTSAT